MPSVNLNTEVDFRLYGCHPEKSIWHDIITPPRSVRLRHLASRGQMTRLWIYTGQNQYRNSLMAQQNQYLYMPAVDSDISWNLVCIKCHHRTWIVWSRRCHYKDEYDYFTVVVLFGWNSACRYNIWSFTQNSAKRYDKVSKLMRKYYIIWFNK